MTHSKVRTSPLRGTDVCYTAHSGSAGSNAIIVTHAHVNTGSTSLVYGYVSATKISLQNSVKFTHCKLILLLAFSLVDISNKFIQLSYLGGGGV
jgi:hypothetical protein